MYLPLILQYINELSTYAHTGTKICVCVCVCVSVYNPDTWADEGSPLGRKLPFSFKVPPDPSFQPHLQNLLLLNSLSILKYTVNWEDVPIIRL